MSKRKTCPGTFAFIAIRDYSVVRSWVRLLRNRSHFHFGAHKKKKLLTTTRTNKRRKYLIRKVFSLAFSLPLWNSFLAWTRISFVQWQTDSERDKRMRCREKNKSKKKYFSRFVVAGEFGVPIYRRFIGTSVANGHKMQSPVSTSNFLSIHFKYSCKCSPCALHHIRMCQCIEIELHLNCNRQNQKTK